jgi:uncharacterized OsmC-like protein
MDKWTGKTINVGPTVFSANVRGHSVFHDVPEDLGGDDTQMMPPESILTALGNCMATVIALTCENKGVPYQGMTVDIEADVVDDERLDNFKLTINMPEELDENQKRIVDDAESLCKVRNTLINGASVDVTIAD